MATGLMAMLPAKPGMFVLGDSISIHYGPHLAKFLYGTVEMEQKQAETINGKKFSRNGGDSRRVLAYLSEKLEQPGFKPDYMLLNCGLHDIGYDSITHKLKVPADEYRHNLEKIFTMIRKKKISIIWVTTTPVVDSIHNSRIKELQRYAKDLAQYNQIAAELCLKYAVNTIDLHDFTLKLGNDAYIDNVHYKEGIRELQAAYIAGALKEIIKEKTNGIAK
jgi:lysophospholipase L1-like esterase